MFRNKSNIFDASKKFKIIFEVEISQRIRYLRIDQGREFNSTKF